MQIPSPPKRDFTRLMQPGAERLTLRFSARLAEGGAPRALAPADRGRRFTLSYFLADDTLSIYEPVVPNSGVVGGKYLERGRAYKGGGGAQERYYAAADLWVGARLPLHGRTFELTAADEFTLHHMETHAAAFPMADAAAAAAGARAQARAAEAGGRAGAVEGAEAALRRAAGGGATGEAVQAALKEAGVSLALHQAIALCRQAAPAATA